MDWNGVIGSVASIINTALAFLFSTLEDTEGKIFTISIGPATLYKNPDFPTIGNFDPTGKPILFNFISAETQDKPNDSTNLSIELAFGDSFDATTWLQQYHDGHITIGITTGQSTVLPDLLQGVWTFATQTVLTAGNSISNVITAVVNPTLTLELRLDVGNNVVTMTAIGAFTVITTYMITARNNSGQTGTRSGSLSQIDQSASLNPIFALELPSGINYSEGIYYLELQLPIELSSSSNATNATVHFEHVLPEVQAAMVPVRMVKNWTLD